MTACLRRLLTCALIALSGAVTLAAGVEAGRVDEYRVKAAFLFNFARFVEWPVDTFRHPSAPLTLCVLGVDPFGALLEQELQRQSTGRPITTRRISQIEPGCHLVFISGSERKRLSVLADALRSAHVLTVSEEEGFGRVGGMIELFTDGDSVRFNIYPDEVERAGLRASSRLITLAANQRHAGGGRR